MDPSFPLFRRDFEVVVASNQKIARFQARESGALAGRSYQPLECEERQPKQVNQMSRQIFQQQGEIGHGDESLETDEIGTLERVEDDLEEFEESRKFGLQQTLKKVARLHMQGHIPELADSFESQEPLTQIAYFQDMQHLKSRLKKHLNLENPLVFDKKHIEIYLDWLKLRRMFEEEIRNYFSLKAAIKERLLEPKPYSIEDQLDQETLNNYLSNLNMMLKQLKDSYNDIKDVPFLNAPDSLQFRSIQDQINTLCEMINTSPEIILREMLAKYAVELKFCTAMKPRLYFREIVLDRVYSLEAAMNLAPKTPSLQIILDHVNILKRTLRNTPEVIFRGPMLKQILALYKLVKSQVIPFDPSTLTKKKKKIHRRVLREARRLTVGASN